MQRRTAAKPKARGRGGGARVKPRPQRAPAALPPMNRETTDVELDTWGKAHIPGFSGVVARNELDRIWPTMQRMPPGSSAVVNLDYGYRRGGSHWVAVRVAKEAPVVLYVDSFGMPPAREVVLKARKEGRGILWSDVMRQSTPEVNCGPRALAALAYLAKNASAGKEIESFGRVAQVV